MFLFIFNIIQIIISADSQIVFCLPPKTNQENCREYRRIENLVIRKSDNWSIDNPGKGLGRTVYCRRCHLPRGILYRLRENGVKLVIIFSLIFFFIF